MKPAQQLDGQSLLDLLQGSKSGSSWREWIDLEHDICYNVTNHWNALTDGHTKASRLIKYSRYLILYIFGAPYYSTSSKLIFLTSSYLTWITIRM